MNEEEKKAIEELEEFIKGPCEICKHCEAAYKLNRKNIIQLLNLTKKLQKENEELEEINNELEAEKNEAIRRYNFETIPIKKVKDKIEEIQEEGYWIFTIDRDSDECVEVLQQLLEKE